MTGEFETACRSMLKLVMREVADEVLSERFSTATENPKRSARENCFLLRSSEAAEHRWIETFGANRACRELRSRIRQ